MKESIKINLRSLFFDSIFLIICYFCIYIYGKYTGDKTYVAVHPIILVLGIAAAILVIHFIPVKINDNKTIYKNKKALIPFIILITAMLVLIILLNKLFQLNNNTGNSINKMYILLLQLCISLSVLICYFFNIKLKFFNWNISIKSFILVIAAYIVFKLICSLYGIYDQTINIYSILNISLLMKFLLSAILNSVYPAFFEEVLCRGFLISGLKGFGLSDTKCNIIQAIIFGLCHSFSWGTPSLISLLMRASQVMIGYVLGKIYFKTKSLLPCILFHGLIDAVA